MISVIEKKTITKIQEKIFIKGKIKADLKYTA